MPNVTRRCSLDGCERPHNSHGLCNTHLRQLRRASNPLRCKVDGCERTRQSRLFCSIHLTCEVTDCDKPRRSNGYCVTHASRLRRHGTPDLATNNLDADSLPGEEWRAIPSCPGNEASTHGRIRSLDQLVDKNDGSSQPVIGRILAANPDKRGRLRVTINGRSRRVHVLVAEAFHGERPPGLEVCHNNGIDTDNRPENLRYDTHAGNMQDKRIHGTDYWANKTRCPRNHEYTEANTRIDARGSRCCRACAREKARERRAKKRCTQDD